ncbi:hypothetical protein SDC9_179355 [bioreactor metagenome]|uniref:Uncharacterized protein n=1 Tax=bioreactor metagenome TaxID=1076179 RepID=A0A645GZP5_9ZZZZ
MTTNRFAAGLVGFALGAFKLLLERRALLIKPHQFDLMRTERFKERVALRTLSGKRSLHIKYILLRGDAARFKRATKLPDRFELGVDVSDVVKELLTLLVDLVKLRRGVLGVFFEYVYLFLLARERNVALVNKLVRLGKLCLKLGGVFIKRHVLIAQR